MRCWGYSPAIASAMYAASRMDFQLVDTRRTDRTSNSPPKTEVSHILMMFEQRLVQRSFLLRRVDEVPCADDK